MTQPSPASPTHMKCYITPSQQFIHVLVSLVHVLPIITNLWLYSAVRKLVLLESQFVVSTSLKIIVPSHNTIQTLNAVKHYEGVLQKLLSHHCNNMICLAWRWDPKPHRPLHMLLTFTLCFILNGGRLNQNLGLFIMTDCIVSMISCF